LSETPQLVKFVSEDQVLAMIRASFGDQTEITCCHPILGGQYNTLYDIETQNPDHHVVLRIAPSSDLPLRRYERTMMLAEPHMYDLLRNAGVPTGKILSTDGSRTIIDRDYLIMDFIEAVPVNHPSVPEDVRPHIMRKAGEYTKVMHSIMADKFGWITPDGSVRGSTSWAEAFGELMVETYTNCQDTGIITGDQADMALECYWKNRDIFDECKIPSFVHNDLWAPNIMVREKDEEWQIEAIIDADRSLFADREFEFAIWENGDKNLLSGYGIPPDKSPNAMLRKRFYSMQLYMQYSWFYLVLMSDPGFQATAKKIALDILQELTGNNS
jgi:aminoglycoside phosphotransferase (APT) family kinase protein